MKYWLRDSVKGEAESVRSATERISIVFRNGIWKIFEISEVVFYQFRFRTTPNFYKTPLQHDWCCKNSKIVM